MISRTHFLVSLTIFATTEPDMTVGELLPNGAKHWRWDGPQPSSSPATDSLGPVWEKLMGSWRTHAKGLLVEHEVKGVCIRIIGIDFEPHSMHITTHSERIPNEVLLRDNEQGLENSSSTGRLHWSYHVPLLSALCRNSNIRQRT